MTQTQLATANGKLRAAGNPLIESIVNQLRRSVKDLFMYMKTSTYLEDVKREIPEYQDPTIVTEDEFQ